MSNAKLVSTPLEKHFKLSVNQCLKTNAEVECMSNVPYANAVGYLMYVMVCTISNLAHAISTVCKFMSNSGKRHWEAVKWILRYLKGTIGHGIMFGDHQGDPSSVARYVNFGYAGDFDDKRSTTGHAFTLVSGLVCWNSIIQSLVTM